MKIIVRKRDNNVIYGTDDNSVNITMDGSTLSIGSFKIKNYTPSDFFLVEDDSVNLINPFFSGYVEYNNAELSLTNTYTEYNTNIKIIINNIINEYTEKSSDDSYSSEERAEFLEYAQDLETYLEDTTYVPPSYIFKTPPDQLYPWYPS